MWAAAWWSALDAAVRAAAPRVLPALDPRDDTLAYWYTSPAQAGADLLLWTPLLAAVFWVLLRGGPARLWRVAVSPAAPGGASGGAGTVQALLVAVDAALRVCVWATAASTLYIKLSTGRSLLFLLQPCHLSNALLCALTLVDARGRWGEWAARALHVDMLAKYGTAAALIVPDVGPAPIWGETTYFFVQHWALCLLPAVWLLRRRFALYTGTRAVAFAWAACSALHLCLLLPVTLLSGRNLNYMSAPPRGPDMFLPVEHYRSVIAVTGIGMAAAMRFLVVAPLACLGEALAGGGAGGGDQPARRAELPVPRRVAATAASAARGAGAPSPRRPRRRSLALAGAPSTLK